MAAHSAGPAADLKLEIENSPAGILVHCSGKIIATTTGALLDKVRPLVSDSKKIVLDLAQVGYIDSSGLGTIVRLWSTAQKSNCALRVANLAPRIKELVAMTNLGSIFEC